MGLGSRSGRDATPGFSALQLQRQWGSGRYDTARAMLHKLRRAMGRPDRERLQAKVEVDDTDSGDTALVVAAVEVRGRASGRVRLHVVPDASAPSLTGFVAANVEPGALIVTDGWKASTPLRGMGSRHRPNTQGDPEQAAKILPRVHRVFGNLQTWLLGTHHGVGYPQLQASLDEFTFRFHRRRTPMAAFHTLLGLGAQHPPTPCNQLEMWSQPDRHNVRYSAVISVIGRTQTEIDQAERVAQRFEQIRTLLPGR